MNELLPGAIGMTVVFSIIGCWLFKENPTYKGKVTPLRKTSVSLPAVKDKVVESPIEQ